MFKIGLVINPIAGIGGPAALKGSDGESTYQKAKALGFESKAAQRAALVVSLLQSKTSSIKFVTCEGLMGEQSLVDSGFEYSVVYKPQTPLHTSPSDTRDAVIAMQRFDVDLILFVGGDGTARDVCSVVDSTQPVLGIPAGVKMHSGVFSVTPKAAAKLVLDMIQGGLVSIGESEVRDIDEDAFRDGVVKSRHYGEMLTPQEGQYLQHVKCGGKEIEALVLDDIASEIIDNMEDDILYVIGSGSTTKHIKNILTEGSPVETTLLGVDLFQGHQLVAGDVDEHQLNDWLLKYPSRLVITLIGGQGHLFGRGNQQLSARNIREIGLDNIVVVATKTKIKALEGQALVVDTGDDDLDQRLAGLRTIITGYDDRIVYPIAYLSD